MEIWAINETSLDFVKSVPLTDNPLTNDWLFDSFMGLHAVEADYCTQ